METDLNEWSNLYNVCVWVAAISHQKIKIKLEELLMTTKHAVTNTTAIA